MEPGPGPGSAGWSCGACTFLSTNPGSARCPVCNTPRGYAEDLERRVEKEKAAFERRFGKELVGFFIPYPDMKGCNSGETAAAEIIDGLWLSGSERARDLAWIKGKRIEALLNCAGSDVILPDTKELQKALYPIRRGPQRRRSTAT